MMAPYILQDQPCKATVLEEITIQLLGLPNLSSNQNNSELELAICRLDLLFVSRTCCLRTDIASN